MAANDSLSDQETGFRGSIKSYGETVVQDGAHAHLGDVSQDVNIQGGLHLHFHTPIGIISIADAVVGLLQAIDTLRTLGSEIEEIEEEIQNRLRREERIKRRVATIDLVHLRATLIDLPSTLSGLEAVANLWVCHASEKSLQALLSSLVGDVQILLRLLHPVIKDAVKDLNNPVHSGTNPHADVLSDTELLEIDRSIAENRLVSHHNTQPTETRSQMIEAKLAEKRVTRDTAKIRLADQALDRFKLAFLEIWIDEHLAGRLNVLLQYRKALNEHLYAILNPRDLAIPKQPSHSSPPNADNDIVEVLSINRSVETGVQNIAAILTRRNGTTETIASENLGKDRTEIYNNNNLIRYDLKTPSDLGRSSRDLFVGHAPNFAHKIKEALYFDEEDDRRTEVKDAHKKTFNWIFEEKSNESTTHFQSWLEEGDDCYWINGKAGSGKSTLMKHIHQHSSLRKLLNTWSGSKQLIVATFFFWHAGQPLQKTHEGVLRSLLRQVLEKRPSLTPIVFPRISRFFLRHGDYKHFSISLADLQEAIMLLKSNMPEDLTLFLMIDGVDEYSGNHFDFCKLLISLANNKLIKVLVSSRPLPACHQIFSRCKSLRLQDLTADDVRAYVTEELLQDQLFIEMDSLEPGFAEEIKEALTEKSSGVFLWIVLVVRRLIIALGNYDDRAALMAKIDELPNDLERLYDHMFGNMSEEYQREGSLLIQLVSCARDVQQCSLTALQLFMANQGHEAIKFSSQDVSYKAEIETLYVKAIDGKLRSRCCGLVEVQYTTGRSMLREPKVDFFHRTVYDYLREPHVWTKVTSLHSLSPADAHLSLLASCIHVLKRRSQTSAIKGPVSPWIMESFVACLHYSHQLNCLGDNNYVDLLEAADVIFLKYCQHTSKTSSYSMYERAFEMFALFHGFLLPDKRIAVEAENSLTLSSLITVGRLGFPLFFTRKVQICGSDSTTKSLLLIQLLDIIIERRSSVFTQFQVQNVKSLLSDGANPNISAKQVVPEYGRRILVEAARLSGADGRDLIPWIFWIVSCNDLSASHFGSVHIRITLQLLNAGAELDGSNEKKANALKKFKSRLESFLDTGAETELRPMIERILGLLVPSDISHKPRKRKR